MKETKVTTGDFVRQTPHKKQILIGAAAGMVVIAAAVLFVIRGSGTPSDIAASKQQTVDQAVYGETLNPDYNTATSNLEEQLKNTTDKTKKADIYIKLAAIAGQKTEYAQSAEYSKKASEADPSRADALAYQTAEALRKAGDSAAARQYYEVALTYYTSLPDEGSNGKAYYLSDIKAKLGQAQ